MNPHVTTPIMMRLTLFFLLLVPSATTQAQPLGPVPGRTVITAADHRRLAYESRIDDVPRLRNLSIKPDAPLLSDMAAVATQLSLRHISSAATAVSSIK